MKKSELVLFKLGICCNAMYEFKLIVKLYDNNGYFTTSQ